MISVAQLEEALETLFGEETNQLAKDTGFIKRERAVTGAKFALTLALSWLAKADCSLGEVVQMARASDLIISESGLSQRFTPEAADFLRELLDRASRLCLKADPVEVAMWRPFPAVIVEDSTTITLPQALLEVWKGCGGSANASSAAVKVHVRFDLRTGAIMGLRLTDASVSDNSSPFRSEGDETATAPAGCLYLADLGYFALPWIKAFCKRGETGKKRAVLMRLKQGTVLQTRHKHRLQLRGVLPQQVGKVVEMGVLLGVEACLPVRLLMVRLPEEVVQQRRERLQEEANDHGREVSAEQWFLAQWTILLTTVPRRVLGIGEVCVLLRMRWQIELLFKLWKEHGQIDDWRSKSPWRILCEFYGKLIAMLLQQWLLQYGIWDDPYRSLVKAAQVVRKHALSLLYALRGRSAMATVLTDLRAMMQQGCHVTVRKDRPCAAQLLSSGIDWTLT